MIRITVGAPQWAIDSGLAQPGDTDTDLFEDSDEYGMDEFTKSGQLIERQHVTADNDDEMFVLMYD